MKRKVWKRGSRLRPTCLVYIRRVPQGTGENASRSSSAGALGLMQTTSKIDTALYLQTMEYLDSF